MNKKMFFAGLAFTLGSVVTANAFAQAKPDVLVKQRQAGMTLIAKYFGPLGGMAAGRVPFNAAVAARNGAEFVALLRDDDTCSSGMSAEYAAWCDVQRWQLRDLTKSTSLYVRAGSWSWWRQACARAGLLSDWAELLDAPGNARGGGS